MVDSSQNWGMRCTHSATSTAGSHRSGPSAARRPGWWAKSLAWKVSTTGALKHTASKPSTSMTARMLRVLLRHRSPGRYRCHEPVIRMWVWRMVPSSQPISMCFPRLSTRSITAPMAGRWPFRRGASNPVMTFSSSAARSAVAVRWMVSPSGTAPRLRGPEDQTSVAVDETHPLE